MSYLKVAYVLIAAIMLYAPLAYFDGKYLKVPKRLFQALLALDIIVSWLIYRELFTLLVSLLVAGTIYASFQAIKKCLRRPDFIKDADVIALTMVFPLLLTWSIPAFLLAGVFWILCEYFLQPRPLPFMVTLWASLFTLLSLVILTSPL